MCAALLLAGRAAASELVRDRVVSALLGRDIPLSIYLPDGYTQAGGKMPAIYLLHGAGGGEGDWTAYGRVHDMLDGMVRRGRIPPTVVVMPGSGPTSWWVDGAAEKMATALLTEVIPHVEGKYKVGTERAQRAVGGFSMGGYGALNLSLAHPDKFCAAALISPAIYEVSPPPTSAALASPQFRRNGGFDAGLWRELNWPARLAEYHARGIVVPMWIASGDHDALGIALESAKLYWQLFQIQKQAVELRIVDGDHDWTVFGEALHPAVQYLDRQCALGRR